MVRPEKRRRVLARESEVAACVEWVLAKVTGEQGDAARTLHALTRAAH